MKILLVAPEHANRARGNTVTVERWRDGVAATPHAIEVTTPSALDDAANADVIHAHHAVHCGPAAMRAADRIGARLVVSLGGTDLNEGPDDRAAAVLRRADVVVGPFASDADRLEAALGRRPVFVTVRRGVVIGGFSPLPRCGDQVEVLMVGGVRPVKGQRDAVAWLRALADQGVRTRLSLAGPVVDDVYGAALLGDLEGTPHRMLGELDPDGVADEMARCHVLLNSSLHEGASNAILEAWAAGRPVAARSAPGNRELLAPAPEDAAVLFEAADLSPLARFLATLRDARPADRTRIAATAHAWARSAHDAGDEIEELLGAYDRAVD